MQQPNSSVIVDFTPRFSSFGYRGRLHLEFDPVTGQLIYSGWKLSPAEIETFKAFLSDTDNIRGFFDDRLAYSVQGPMVIDSGPYSLSMEWNGRRKTISVGFGKSIPYRHPFF